MPPGPPELREGVQEDDERAVTGEGHMEAGAIGGNVFVLPWTCLLYTSRCV